MGFTGTKYYDVAMKIVNDIFLVKYLHTTKENNTWYENLNNFLVTEWVRIQESEQSQTQSQTQTQSQLIDDEEVMIISDAMQVVLTKLNVNEDDFDRDEHHVDWIRFDDIIIHYMYSV